MTFGDVPVAASVGGILAHSVPTPQGRLRKGRVLTQADAAQLAQAGLTHVTVARLGPMDVHEDAAALRVAQALVPDPASVGLRLGAASTGRVNIHATGPGVLALEAAVIHAVNAPDPMLTVATVPPWQRVTDGMMVATVKIISYGVRAAHLDLACRAAAVAAQGALRCCSPVHRRVTLIETTVGHAPLGDKGARVTADRLTRLGAALVDHVHVPHDTSAVAQAIGAAQATSDMILILT
ncbi:MAG: molybdopterin biosynthesis protein, partial [Paracoccaceae bacterium]